MRPPFPKQFIYAAIIVVPFWLLFFNSPFWHNIKLTFMGFGAVSVAVARWPVQEAEKLLTYRQTFNAYQKLKREVTSLKSRVISLEEMVREAGRGERLAQFKARQLYDSIPAVVIARDPANWNASLMINRGKADGIRPGMPVIDPYGVVGKVAEVAQGVSKVILINDPGFSVAAVNRRSRESALVSGSLSGKCRLSYLPANADIEVGDDIITAAISTDFPEGIMIGTVTSVMLSVNGGPSSAEVVPSVEVAKIEDVLVIK
jgi:rod shape-determining protein MreC